MKKFISGFLIAMTLVIVLPVPVLASVGVGVGTGKIDVKDKLKAGGIYTLPAITVYNTGTQEATYTMELTLNERQPQLKPNPNWFSFSPSTFKLKPKETKVIIPTLNMPLTAQSGDYFGYLEAHPDKTVKQGTATVGVAAATKLSFTVVPYNIFLATLLRAQSLYIKAAPWSQIATFAFILAILYRVTRRHFNIKISRT
jgi:hypothetical protein